MHFDEDDFYNETHEFDSLINDFKTSLLKKVKDDYVAEMEKLRQENRNLQHVKDKFEEIKKEYRQKERDLELKEKNMERTVRNERLSSLMKDFQIIMYRPSSATVKNPKCDKCDSNRRIKYKTPLGKEAYESCTCNKGKLVYSPKEHMASEFKIHRDKHRMSVYYKSSAERDGDYASHDSVFAETIWNSDMKYENLSYYRTFFKTPEECQGYCDYLNINEEMKQMSTAARKK